MSTKDEALKLSLEALEETLKTLDDANTIPGGPIADTIWYSPHETLVDYLAAKITEIKQALAAQPDQVAWLGFNPRSGEPEFSIDKPPPSVVRDFKMRPLVYGYTTLPSAPVQEPVAPKIAAQLRAMACNYPAGHLWDKLDAKACIEGALLLEGRHPKAPPAAQRQSARSAWVGLTDEQIGKAWAVAEGEHNASASVKRRITRSIEAAHGIKEKS